jgi:hypothetical protein
LQRDGLGVRFCAGGRRAGQVKAHGAAVGHQVDVELAVGEEVAGRRASDTT